MLSKENSGVYQPSIKIIPLFILEIVSAFLMSFYFRQFLVFFNGYSLIWFLVGLGVFIISSFFAALFLKGFIWSALAAGFSVMVSLAVFYDHFSAALNGFGFVVFLVFAWGIFKLQRALENTLEIDFFHLAKVFLSKMAMGTAILLSVFSYFLFSVKGGPVIPLEAFKAFLRPNEKVVAVFFPGFSFDKSLQLFLADVLEKQLADKVPNFATLPVSIKEGLIAPFQQQIVDGLQKFSGIKISLKDPISDVAYDVLAVKFSQLNEPLKSWTLIGVFVGLFFTIQILFVPINWLLSIVLFLIYSFLLAVNFASIKMESRSKEVVEI